MNKKLLSLFMAIVMMFSLSIPAFAAENARNDYITIEELNNYHNEVRALQSQRSLLQMEQYKKNNNGISTASLATINAKLKEVDSKLEKLGVRKVSLSELSFVTKNRSIEVPDADNERWELEEYTNAVGVTSDVQFNSTSHNDLNYKIYTRSQSGIMNTDADELDNAIDSFLNYYQVMHSFVNYVTITGIGNKSVIKNYVCQEVYPGMIY